MLHPPKLMLVCLCHVVSAGNPVGSPNKHSPHDSAIV